MWIDGSPNQCFKKAQGKEEPHTFVSLAAGLATKKIDVTIKLVG